MGLTASTRPLRSLRYQLILALGVLSLLLVTVIAITVISLTRMNQVMHQTIEIDGRLSRLANEVAIHTLLCRRYEKEIFLNLDDVGARLGYLAQWNSAYLALEQKIAAFESVATTPEDRQQAELWRTASGNYQATFLQVRQAIADKSIATPGAANKALGPVSERIRTLTDTAVITAERKNDLVEDANAALIAASAATTQRLLWIGLAAVVMSICWSLLFPQRLMHPVIALKEAAQQLARGDLQTRVALDRADELGDLARSFNDMATTIQARTSDLEAQYAVAQAARLEAEASRANLVDQLDMIESQRVMIREMSVPILPLNATTLVMPLVGALDSDRLRLVQDEALRRIESTAAQYLILDVTGLPIIDTHVAQGLIQIVQSARLLGAEVLLVGIRPEVAQAIVGLGLHLNNITTYSSLQSGVTYVLGHQKTRI